MTRRDQVVLATALLMCAVAWVAFVLCLLKGLQAVGA